MSFSNLTPWKASLGLLPALFRSSRPEISDETASSPRSMAFTFNHASLCAAAGEDSE